MFEIYGEKDKTKQNSRLIWYILLLCNFPPILYVVAIYYGSRQAREKERKKRIMYYCFKQESSEEPDNDRPSGLQL